MINVLDICRQIEADSKYTYIQNIKVFDHERETLIIAVKEHFPNDIDEDIFNFPFGNYFITDKGAIFSKKIHIEKIERKEAAPELIKTLTKGMNKKQLAKFFDSNAADGDVEEFELKKTYFIYKRNQSQNFMRFYIGHQFRDIFERNGYTVTRDISFQKYLNLKTGEMEHIQTFSVRLSQETFASFCKNTEILRKGMKIENGKTVAIKTGRPSREITLADDSGTILHFVGQKEVAQHFGISIETVKRAFKNKGAGDTVKLKKTNFQLLG